MRELRRELHLSQPELADRGGVGVRTIKAWERGENLPRTTTLRVFAARVGKPLSFFID